MAADPRSEADAGWYQEFNLQFEDGAKRQFYLHVTRSGRRLPSRPQEPAEWTRLDFHRCPGCPLADAASHCPAAVALDNTLAKLRGRISYENVRATAVDGENRTASVAWPLQQVGSIFVQLAVFASGCPVGDRVRPYLRDLRPFATTAELARHVIGKLLLRHRGAVASVQNEVRGLLEPLRAVFAHLLRRLRSQAAGRQGDAVVNSVVNVDAFAQYLALQVEALGRHGAVDIGWTPLPARRTPLPEPGFWRRFSASLFGGSQTPPPPRDTPLPGGCR